MSLVIPFIFTGGPGNKAKASEVNANFAAVAAKFTEGAGGIADADISTTAAIKGSKLSTTPGTRIPTAALEDEAVTDVKLNNDTAVPGVDAGRAVGGEHIKLLTAVQMGRFLPDTPSAGIGSNKVKFTFHEVAFSFSAAGTGQAPTNGYVLTDQAVNPSSSFATATYDLVGLYVKTPVAGLMLVGYSTTSGANFAGGVRAGNNQTAAITATGSLVYVFAQKA